MSGNPLRGKGCFTVIVGIVLLVASVSAFATGTINGSIHHNTFGGSGGSAALDVVNKNNNVNKNLNANANLNSLSNTVNAGGNGGVKVPHQAPSFGIGTMFPTAPCQGTKGGGFSVPWGGAALSGSHTLRECEIRETIRTVIHMNGAGIDTGDTAARLLCMTENAKDLPFCNPFVAAVQAKIKMYEANATPVPEVRRAKLEDLFPWNW